jgi:hypothetical protein
VVVLSVRSTWPGNIPAQKNYLAPVQPKVQHPALNCLGFHNLAFRSLRRRLAIRPSIALWINPFSIYTPFSFILFYEVLTLTRGWRP